MLCLCMPDASDFISYLTFLCYNNWIIQTGTSYVTREDMKYAYLGLGSLC